MQHAPDQNTLDVKGFMRLTQSVFQLYLSVWQAWLSLWLGLALIGAAVFLADRYLQHQSTALMVSGLVLFIGLAFSLFMAHYFFIGAYLKDSGKDASAVDDWASLLASQYDQFCGALLYSIGFLGFMYGAIISYGAYGVLFTCFAFIATFTVPALTLMAWDNVFKAMGRGLRLYWASFLESSLLALPLFVCLLVWGILVALSTPGWRPLVPAWSMMYAVLLFLSLALPLMIAFVVVLVDLWLQRVPEEGAV